MYRYLSAYYRVSESHSVTALHDYILLRCLLLHCAGFLLSVLPLVTS